MTGPDPLDDVELPVIVGDSFDGSVYTYADGRVEHVSVPTQEELDASFESLLDESEADSADHHQK